MRGGFARPRLTERAPSLSQKLCANAILNNLPLYGVTRLFSVLDRTYDPRGEQGFPPISARAIAENKGSRSSSS